MYGNHSLAFSIEHSNKVQAYVDLRISACTRYNSQEYSLFIFPRPPVQVITLFLDEAPENEEGSCRFAKIAKLLIEDPSSIDLCTVTVHLQVSARF
jgi:hypothetical protein